VQGAGVRATFGNPDNWVIGASVQTFGLAGTPVDPGSGKLYGGLSVYGVDFNGAIPFVGSHGLTADLSWTASDNATKPYNFNDAGNGWRYQSTDDQIGYTWGALSIKGGYQYVGPDFSAPGYWGKLGSWTNPTNIEGGVVSAKYIINPKLVVKGDYEGYNTAYGSNKANGVVSPFSSPLQQGDHLDHYQIGLAYGLTSNYNVDLGYEESLYDLKNNNGTLLAAGKPTQSFINIGIGHSFSANSDVKLLYQIGQYRDKGTGFGPPGGDADGNEAVAQFSSKF
jgi:hypothetical protein